MSSCEFCSTKFSSNSSLKHHQKTARYCLEKQGKKLNKFICETCKKEFSTKRWMINHYQSCIKHAIKTSTEVLEKEVAHLKDIIQDLKMEKKKLQKSLEKAATRPINVTANQQNNKIQQINNFLPITDKHLQDHVNNLTIEHVKAGPSGYAKYALEYPLKDNIVCTDFSRRKIKYKNNDGQIITDPEMTTLSKKLFSAIRDRNSELIKTYSKELQEKFWGIPNEAGNDLEEKEIEDLNGRMNEVGDVLFAIMSQDRQVRELANGVRSEMYHEFIKHVCSACI